MQGIGGEWIAFLEAVLAGMIVYTSYFCIRKLRRVWRHNLFVIAVEDLMFWIASAIYLFVQIYYTSDGSIRWNFVLGVALGSVFLLMFENLLKKLEQKMYIKKHRDFKKRVDKKK